MAGIARGLGIATLVIGYALLVHYTNESPRHASLGAVVSIVPLALIAAVFAWHSPHRALMLGLLAVLCVGLWAGWGMLERHFGLVNWLQHVGWQLVLFAMFGRTLLAGRQPLCTRFANAIHAPLTARQEIYTRQVTVAWTMFFAVMALVSTLLYFLASLAAWSVFANMLTLPLVALMFIVEYGVRKRVLPDMHTHILDAVRAFSKVSTRPR